MGFLNKLKNISLHLSIIIFFSLFFVNIFFFSTPQTCFYIGFSLVLGHCYYFILTVLHYLFSSKLLQKNCFSIDCLVTCTTHVANREPGSRQQLQRSDPDWRQTWSLYARYHRGIFILKKDSSARDHLFRSHSLRLDN